MLSPNNLPQQMTSFVGREHEMAETMRLLVSARLLTLTGPGGSGKTRLALEVAGSSLNNYPDGVWLVDLAPLASAGLVAQAVATAVGVREESGQAVIETLSRHLRGLKVLLVMDNCEHVVASCAQLADRLLRECMGLRILATSREALGVEGESIWPVLPLRTPDPRQDISPERVEEYEAIRLFVERARARRPDFRVTGENAAWVVQLCHSLDGIPLAIELAAARVKVLSVEQIASRLDERFRLLTSDNRAALPRQQTLEALINWSYDLLPESEQWLFHACAAFVGGFTLEGLSSVCKDLLDEYEVIELLSRLVDKSLVIMEERGGLTRYRLLESIRQYGRGKGRQAGSLPGIQKRHLDYYLQVAGQSEDELLTERQGVWLERLEAEHDNLRAALLYAQAWTQEGEGEGDDTGLCLAGSLVWFWYFRGYVTEGREWLGEMLRLCPDETNGVRAKALSAAGVLAFLQSDYGHARSHLQEGLGVWKQLEDRRGMAFTLTFLGRVALRQGEVREAREMGEESVRLFKELEDKWGLALALDFIGVCAQEEGDFGEAGLFHNESLALYRELGHRWGVALELSNFGRVALQEGRYEAARARLEEALEIQREVGDKWIVAWTLHNLGDVARTEGSFGRAEALYSEAITLFLELRDRGGVANTLQMLGQVAGQMGEHERGEALLNEGGEILRELGDVPMAAGRNVSTPWTSGQPMSIGQALAFALQDSSQRGGSLHVAGGHESEPSLRTRTKDGESFPVGLTRREVEVLRLIAEGVTDAQLAERLSLSTRTVHAHVRSIYSKLGVNTRSAATRYAIEHGVV